MTIKPIITATDYTEALKEIEGHMDAKPDTPDGDMLGVLSTLVEAYECKAYSLKQPDTTDVIKFYMEQDGLTPNDLIFVIGQRHRVHDVLNHRRPLTLRMICQLHEIFGISSDALIKESPILQRA